jgi:hypothetical protein
MTRRVALQFVSQFAGLISILILYWAGFGVPWELQTWDGGTPVELGTVIGQKILGYIGLVCALIAAGCQMILTLQAETYR